VVSDVEGAHRLAQSESKGSHDSENSPRDSTNIQRLSQCLQLPSDWPTGGSCVWLMTSVYVSSSMSRVLNRQVMAYKRRVAHK
jgi:hypothetical protein